MYYRVFGNIVSWFNLKHGDNIKLSFSLKNPEAVIRFPILNFK